MRTSKLLFVSLLACTSLAHADLNGTDVLWTDNFGGTKPITDSGNTALEVGDVIQVGYFAGVNPDKDPDNYSAADWASFTAIAGDGSLNPNAFPSSIIGAGLAPPGYFTYGLGFDTTVHSGIPTQRVRIGLQFYDANAVASATNYNTVSSSDESWILPTPLPPPPVSPNQAFANMDGADLTGTLAWEGTPFKTDLVPGGSPPDLVLTDVALVSPTSLQISWTGGDGLSTIETSTNGTTWTPRGAELSSPAIISVNPALVPALLVRVVEP